MDKRRSFMKMLPALAAIPVAASNDGRGEEPGRDTVLGAWSGIHTLPFPPGSFREFLNFAEGGAFAETNSFLHTASALDFSSFGLPPSISASDGVGSWKWLRDGEVAIEFRKLLFDGSKVNFGDLLVTGTAAVKRRVLNANWHIVVVNSIDGSLLLDFGTASSAGHRIG